MAYTQADVDALKKAIASGTLSVEYDGKRVTYRSLAELQKALALVQGEVNAAAGVTPLRQVQVVADKGL